MKKNQGNKLPRWDSHIENRADFTALNRIAQMRGKVTKRDIQNQDM